MAWPWLAIIAKNVPWAELVRRAPDILDGSRRLLEKNKKHDEGTPLATPQATIENLRKRIEILEERDAEHAKVIAQTVEQLQGLTDGLEVLAARNRLLILLVGVLVVLAVLLAVALLAGPR